MNHSTTWIGICLTVAAGGAHGCGDGDGASGAENAAAGAGGSTAGGASAVAAPGASGSTSTSVDSLIGNCPADRSPASCAGTPCASIDQQAALLCTQGCCTPEGTCGTFNASRGTACIDASGCDGSPVDGAANGGGAGGSTAGSAGGSATAGAAGASMAAGGGAASNDVECPDETVCAENEYIASQMSGFRFCGSDGGSFGHTPPAGSSQEDCDDGPGGNYQDIAGLIEGCFIPCE